MSQAKVLIVEDDAGLREALVDTLLLGGYQVIEADSGEQAMIKLSEQPVDIVVSDIQMGGMSGLSLLKNIKNKFNTVRLVICSTLDIYCSPTN